jgi:hypothetical protein
MGEQREGFAGIDEFAMELHNLALPDCRQSGQSRGNNLLQIPQPVYRGAENQQCDDSAGEVLLIWNLQIYSDNHVEPCRLSGGQQVASLQAGEFCIARCLAIVAGKRCRNRSSIHSSRRSRIRRRKAEDVLLLPAPGAPSRGKRSGILQGNLPAALRPLAGCGKTTLDGKVTLSLSRLQAI